MLSTRNTLVEEAYPVAALVVLTPALSAILFLCALQRGSLVHRVEGPGVAEVGDEGEGKE